MALKYKNTVTKKYEKLRIRYKFKLSFLQMLVFTFASRNNLANKKLFSKIYELIEKTDKEYYFNNDPNIYIHIFILEHLCRDFVIKGLRDFNLSTEKLESGGTHSEEITEFLDTIFEIYEKDDLSDSELLYIDKELSDHIKWGKVITMSNTLSDDLAEIQGNSYERFGESIEKFYDTINDFHAFGSEVRAKELAEDSGFIIGDKNSVLDISEDFKEREKSESLKIKTGIKDLNKMLGGGWEAGRLYVDYSFSGGWKSGFLLNSAIWGVKYNPDIKAKDPTKKPCILYLTTENRTHETFGRIFSYTVENDKDFANNYSTEELAEMVDKRIRKDGNAHLVVKYREKNSISPRGIEAIIEDLENQGYEVMFAVIDYLLTLASDHFAEAEHIRLGHIADGLSNLANKFDIPVLSAMQVTRYAEEKIDNAIGKNDHGLVRLFTRGDVSESKRIINNTDFALFTASEEIVENGRYVLGFKSFKKRGKDTYKVKQMYVPFIKDNGMRLEEDFSLAGKVTHSDVYDIIDKWGISTKISLTGGGNNGRRKSANNSGLMEVINQKSTSSLGKLI